MTTRGGANLTPHVGKVGFQSEARFFQMGELTPSTKFCWLVCHGYGQLSEYFIKKFDGLGAEHFVVAPEGLHRYYHNGTSGRVGASWMTKVDRETDISNYVNYLNALIASLNIPPGIEIVALGFSQGAATIGRWAVQHSGRINHLILWSGMFPHDVDLELARNRLKNTEIHIAHGLSDPYINDERLNAHQAQFDSENIPYQDFVFNGGHEIPAQALQEFLLRI